MTWLLAWQHFLLREFYEGQVPWATSNPRQETLSIDYSNSMHYFHSLPILSAIPTIASSNLVLGKKI